MNFLLQAFSETNGNASSMRVLTGLVVAVIMVGWLSVTWKTAQMAPLPLEGAGGIVLGALGIKAFQRGKEGKAGAGNGAPAAGSGDTQMIMKQ